MFPCKLKTCIQALSIILVLSFVQGQDRKINATLYPGCKNCTENDVFVYIRAEGVHDTIHQIWDFTQGPPVIILTVAGVNSSMTIGWEQTRPQNFTLSEKPKYSFATAIDKLYEYNDVHDNAYIEGCKWRRSVPLARATWLPWSVVLTEQRVMVQLRGHVRDHRRQGVVDIKLDMLPFKDFAVDLPHLIHTANSTLLDVSLVNFTTSADYNASRYALHMVLVSQDPSSANMTCSMRKSLDDEHTPGVFEITEIESPLSAAHAAGGFLQFRPVAYTQPRRDVASSTRARASDFNRTSIPERSTLEAFYRGFDPDNLLVEDLYISFGEPGDGFYKHHNFTAWSSTIGYGAPPAEGFSPFVIGLIACGLAVPCALALAAAGYALCRRRVRAPPRARLTGEH